MDIDVINNHLAKLRNDILIKRTQIMVARNPTESERLQIMLKKKEFQLEIEEIKKKIAQLSSPT